MQRGCPVAPEPGQSQHYPRQPGESDQAKNRHRKAHGHGGADMPQLRLPSITPPDWLLFAHDRELNDVIAQRLAGQQLPGLSMRILALRWAAGQDIPEGWPQGGQDEDRGPAGVA